MSTIFSGAIFGAPLRNENKTIEMKMNVVVRKWNRLKWKWVEEKNENEDSINILPMIDIIFAILSFFIISSLYLTKIDTIKVNLPKSSTAVREQNKPQIITIDNNENIYFNSNEISLTNMSSLIRTNIENLEEPIVILRADTSVKHGFIVNLLDELRKIENLKIGISTEKQLSGL